MMSSLEEALEGSQNPKATVPIDPTGLGPWELLFLWCSQAPILLEATQKNFRADYVGRFPFGLTGFPFLELPAEIRMMVYVELFTYSPVMLSVPPVFPHRWRRGIEILRVCKQIHAEASGFFATDCNIIFCDPEATIDITTRMGHEFTMIQRIDLCFAVVSQVDDSFILQPWAPFLKLLRTQAPALRFLRLRRSISYWLTDAGLLDVLDDASASEHRRKQVIRSLTSLSKIKQLRSLEIHMKVGSAGLRWLEENLDPEVELTNVLWD